MTAPILQLKDVAQDFSSRGRHIAAVTPTDLDIREGEFVTIVGPSGCGKSTLLKIIAGLLPPTRGRVLFRGRDSRGVNPAIGYVPQHDYLFPWVLAQSGVLKQRFTRDALFTDRYLR